MKLFGERTTSPGVRIKYFKTIGVDACQLCGSKYGLEVHHIVPITCGGYDSENNWLLVCKKCHAMLTPSGLLTKIGLDRVRLVRDLGVEFYQKCSDVLDEKDELTVSDVYDIFDEILNKLEELTCAPKHQKCA